jgi:D-glycero-D-manno-heptose 1,7-bisphosphate phosphatase
MNKAVFLDRDGVLNSAVVLNNIPTPPKSLNELKVLPGVFDSLQKLKAANFVLVVITNQPDIARGTSTLQSIEEINSHLNSILPLDAIYMCRHDDVNMCECRKPKPGMLLLAAERLEVNLSESYLIGDRWKDIEAGQSVGCKCYFIDNNYAERRPSRPYTRVSSLQEAAENIIKEMRNESDI